MLIDGSKEGDVALETDAPPDLDEMVAPHAPIFGIVPKQVRELGTFLREIETR
ncbi:MAG: hypothetical protein ABI884_04995 [Gemmatimonadota bacterium]